METTEVINNDVQNIKNEKDVKDGKTRSRERSSRNDKDRRDKNDKDKDKSKVNDKDRHRSKVDGKDKDKSKVDSKDKDKSKVDEKDKDKSKVDGKDKEKSRHRHESRKRSKERSKRSRSKGKGRSHRSRSKGKGKSHRSRSKGKDRSHRSKSKRKERSHRSKSKDRKKHEDISLTTVYKYWDMAPTGYENVQPSEFKAMLAAGQALPNMYTTEGNAADLKSDSQIPMGTAVTRQNRRIYVGNLPLGVTEEGMLSLFNENLRVPGNSEGDAVIAVQVNAEKNFAFLEFRSIEETNRGLALDGIEYNGFPLKLKRPRDYVAMTNDTGNQPSAFMRPENPHKLFVGGLPHYLTEDQVKEILVNFGQLSGFNLVKDATTGLSKGYAFCEYADHSVTEKACQGLTGIEVGDKRIVVQRASDGNRNPPSAASAVGFVVPRCIPEGAAAQETEVLCLHNMIAAEDLVDDDEYEEIVEDVREECGKYGRVASVQVPRVGAEGVGKVYVEFSHKAETAAALRALAGRSFSGRVVVASFYDVEKYRNGFF